MPMIPERWAKIEGLFHKALECLPEDRGALLDRECSGDYELRNEVESLLRETNAGEESFQEAFLEGAAEAMSEIAEAAGPPSARESADAEDIGQEMLIGGTCSLEPLSGLFRNGAAPR
jgi:hypothetical protein